MKRLPNVGRKDSNSTRTTTRSLDDREKLQFLELQRARQNILSQMAEIKLDQNSKGNDELSVGFSSIGLSSIGSSNTLSDNVAKRSANTLKSYGTVSKSKDNIDNRIRMSKTASYIEKLSTNVTKAKFGVDMMPMLSFTSTFGEYTMGLENKVRIARTRGAETVTALRLPVFKLPSIDPTNAALMSTPFDITKGGSQQSKLRVVAPVVNIWSRFIPYNSLNGLRKALLRLTQQLLKQQQQLQDSQSKLLLQLSCNDPKTLLSVSVDDIQLIEHKLSKAIAQHSTAEGLGHDAARKSSSISSSENLGKWQLHLACCRLADTLLLDNDGVASENEPSVFMIVAQGLDPSLSQASINLSIVRRGSTNSLVSSSSIGVNSLNSTSSPPQSVLSSYARTLRPNINTLPDLLNTTNRIANNDATGSKALNFQKSTDKIQRKTATFGSRSKLFASADPALDNASIDKTMNLTSELLGSLKNMENHTIMIKKSIAVAQELVHINDPRARSMLFRLGADKMRVSLRLLLLIDMRRGFEAWRLQQREDGIRLTAGLLLRLLGVRNLLGALEQLLRRWIKANFDFWRRIAQDESHRLRKKKILESAIKIQALTRASFARKRVKVLLQRRKFQKMYDAVITIQALLRGKRIRWRYLARLQAGRRLRAAIKIQKVARGFHGRKRVRRIRQRKRRERAACIIQKIVRSKIARRRVQLIRKRREQAKYVVLIQKLVRGFLGRKNIQTIMLNKARYHYAVLIQSRVRGMLARGRRLRTLKEVNYYRDLRNKACTKIQSAYRGYRSRIITRIKLFQLQKKRKMQAKASTKICNMVRQFLARITLRELRQERMDKWISDAKVWQEMWDEDQQMWYYFNSATEDTLWEPSPQGYMKYDGMLVLASGQIIEDPSKKKKKKAAGADQFASSVGAVDEGEEEEEMDEAGLTEKQRKKLCSECVMRTAIRYCNECGDKFCTKCYKDTHATGTRRKHTFSNIGPIDCTECELRLAERFCVSCDESFCDGCWRKVHSRGKRVFHPFCEVSLEGKVDQRIYTMDGQEISGYNATYPQERVEQEKQKQQAVAMTVYDSSVRPTKAAAADTENGADIAGYDAAAAEWTEYFDDQGYGYWYNNYTGVSQYESPWG